MPWTITLDVAGCFRRKVRNDGIKLAILVGNCEGNLFGDLSMLSLFNTKYSLYFLSIYFRYNYQRKSSKFSYGWRATMQVYPWFGDYRGRDQRRTRDSGTRYTC